MIFDFTYKLARKWLSPYLYNTISYDLLKRRKGYERIETYENIFKHYKENGIDFKEKTVIELGSGLQYFTAFFFLLDGAKKVFLIEPKLVFSLSELKSSLDIFNSQYGSKLTIEDAANRIECYSDLAGLKGNLKCEVDVICSYTVLEHVINLPSIFAECAKILNRNGRCYHLIDLSDHTYQVFARLPFLAGLNQKRPLYHLRYSKKLFEFVNDPKCFMNRKLVPEYLLLAEKNGYTISNFSIKTFDGKMKIHPDLIEGYSPNDSKFRALTLSLSLLKSSNSNSQDR